MDRDLKRALCTALGVVLVLFGAPTLALAEEETSNGIRLLVPELTELIPALIAFSIVFLLLSKFVWPRVVEAMDEREKRLQESLEAAELSQEKLHEAEEEYQKRTADAEHEAADILAAARREAEEERAAILARAQKDAAATLAKAKDAIASERKRAMVELSRSVVDLSVEIAGKIIGEDLSQAEHRALAEKYLEEIGGDYAEE